MSDYATISQYLCNEYRQQKTLSEKILKIITKNNETLEKLANAMFGEGKHMVTEKAANLIVGCVVKYLVQNKDYSKLDFLSKICDLFSILFSANGKFDLNTSSCIPHPLLMLIRFFAISEDSIFERLSNSV